MAHTGLCTRQEVEQIRANVFFVQRFKTFFLFLSRFLTCYSVLTFFCTFLHLWTVHRQRCHKKCPGHTRHRHLSAAFSNHGLVSGCQRICAGQYV